MGFIAHGSGLRSVMRSAISRAEKSSRKVRQCILCPGRVKLDHVYCWRHVENGKRVKSCKCGNKFSKMDDSFKLCYLCFWKQNQSARKDRAKTIKEKSRINNP